VKSVHQGPEIRSNSDTNNLAAAQWKRILEGSADDVHLPLSDDRTARTFQGRARDELGSQSSLKYILRMHIFVKTQTKSNEMRERTWKDRQRHYQNSSFLLKTALVLHESRMT